MAIEYIHERGSRKVNEDKLVVADPLFAVFDGATGFDSFTDGQGKTGALLASYAAARVFSENGRPLTELVRDANRAVGEAMRCHGIDAPAVENRWMTTAVAVRIQEKSFDWVHVGDGNILIVYADGAHSLLAGDVNHDRELFLKWKAIPDKQGKNFWDEMHGELISLRQQANVSYGMLDGSQAALRFVQSGTGSLDAVRSIILFTDGLMVPKEDPRAEDDSGLFMQLFRRGGLRNIYEYTRSAERGDPSCVRYPRAKMHDDATAIAITFSG
ncbi:MAG: protein phosphatase 2C domain-containing protein [Patescibacteria group bacterium]